MYKIEFYKFGRHSIDVNCDAAPDDDDSTGIIVRDGINIPDAMLNDLRKMADEIHPTLFVRKPDGIGCDRYMMNAAERMHAWGQVEKFALRCAKSAIRS